MLKRLTKAVLGAAGLELTRRFDVDRRFLALRLERARSDRAVTPGVIVESMIEGKTVRFFVTDETDYIQHFHRCGRFYEEEALRRIGQLFRGGTFVDVGANVGNHSLYAALYLRAERVVAFEPLPQVAMNLAVNVAINGLSDVVVIHELGLSSSPGRAAFETPPGNIGATRLQAGGESASLPLARGDDLLTGERVSFIKIDTEGMEIEVIEGLRSTIARDRPTLLVEVEVEANGERFRSLLDGLRYRVDGDPILDDQCANYFAVPAD